MGELALSTTDRDLDSDLMAFFEKLVDLVASDDHIVFFGFEAELHGLGLLAGGFVFALLSLLLLIHVFAKIEDLGHGRIGGRADFNQVEASLMRELKCLVHGHNPELYALIVDHLDLGGAYLVVESKSLVGVSQILVRGRVLAAPSQQNNPNTLG